MRMFGKTALVAVLGLGLVGGGGCSRTQQYMATGGALGAGAGAVVAGATGGTLLGGALVGGALGAGTGYVLSR
jgi:osmotically inducible lipoprotein OsmB